MEKFISLIRNKYLLAGVAFLVWMSFFDRYDFATQFSYQQQKNNLIHEKEYYESEVTSIEQAIKDVQFNQNEIQRIAREKYKMKKDKEDIYVITEIEEPKK